MPKMKDSGIEWVKQIPEHWAVMPNKYIVKKEKNICPQYNGEDILSLTMNGVIVRDLDAGGKMPASFNGYQIVSPNNLLMCLFDYDVTPRCIGLIKNHGLTSPAYSQFVMKNSNNEKYYYYYYLMIDNTKELLHLAKNLRHSFTEEQLGMINAPVPPVDEQIQIANFLDQKCSEIDSLQEDIEKEIETLEEYKKSVITEAVTKGLNLDVEMKDSGIEWIGMIPKHWEVHPIYRYFGERKVKNSALKEQNLLSLSYGNIIRKNIETLGGLLPASFNTYNIVEPGDIIIRPTDLQNDKRSLRTGLVKEHGIITSAYIDLKPIGNINSKYFHYLLHTYDVMKVFYNMGNGVRQGLNYSEFAKLMVFAPTLKEQNDIAIYLDSKCNAIDTVVADKKMQLETLDQYKKSLIYEYVTGKKEVPLEEVIVNDKVDKNAVILGIIADKLGEQQSGRIQLQKVHFMMTMCVMMNQNMQYYRYNHGPYDICLNSYIDVLLKNKWYQEKKDGAYILVKGEKHSEFLNIYKELIEKLEPEVNKLLNLLKSMNVLKTSRIERIATLYAAWNDLLLDGVSPTDDQIIEDVMNNWTENKGNTQYATWQDSLEKMKKNGLIPKGTGKHTLPKQQ